MRKGDDAKIREILKQALAGQIDAHGLAQVLRGEEPGVVAVLELPDGTFSMDNQKGLTAEEVDQLVGHRTVFRVKIIPSPVPIFHSEKEVEEWDAANPDFKISDIPDYSNRHAIR